MLNQRGILRLLNVLRLNEFHFVTLVGEMHSPVLIVGELNALLGNELPTKSSRSQMLIKLEILFRHLALMLPVLNEISSEMYCYDHFGFYLLTRRNPLRQKIELSLSMLRTLNLRLHSDRHVQRQSDGSVSARRYKRYIHATNIRFRLNGH